MVGLVNTVMVGLVNTVMVGLVNTVMNLCCAATQKIKDLKICVA